VTGCTETRTGAETSAIDCSDEVDDDGDNFVDCLDPDCWSHAMCRQWMDASLPPEMEPFIPPQTPPVVGTGVWGDSMSEGPSDASTVDAQAPPSSAPDSLKDAGETLTCEDACPEEECRDGRCIEAPLELGSFVIHTVTLDVPRGPDALSCFDSFPECGTSATLPLPCACAPDVQLLIQVAGQSADPPRKAGIANALAHADSHALKALSIEVDLLEADEIIFTALDLDDGAPAQEILRCGVLVTQESLDSGVLRCTQRFQVASELSEDFGVTAEIEAIEADLADSPAP
jgi:hypothetical protein